MVVKRLALTVAKRYGAKDYPAVKLSVRAGCGGLQDAARQSPVARAQEDILPLQLAYYLLF
jgi:hypothetical protein